MQAARVEPASENAVSQETTYLVAFPRRLPPFPGYAKNRREPGAPGDALPGRLYLYFECLGVGVAGFTAFAAQRTSSFVNAAKRNGCDSRK